MGTDDIYREHVRRRRAERRKRDAEAAEAGRITVAEFARQHGLNAWGLRRKMRLAGYDRKGRMRLPIRDLQKFLKE